jgi:DNA polymerase-3 subunit delta'
VTSFERAPLASRLDPARGLPGALLLTGPSESALAEEAGAIAAALLCPGDDPDRSCAACRRTAAGIHPDLFVIAPEGVQIRVDRVREALAFAAGRPYEAPRRVAIVSRAEQLGAEAGNALLKSLEEPGARMQWVLTTTRPESLLPTIRSRCTVARVAPPTEAERVARWRARGFADTDAPDLLLLERERGHAAPEDLETFRQWRTAILESLEAGLRGGKIAALVFLAEALSRAEPGQAHRLAELLADAALIGVEGGVDPPRHRSVAGSLQRLARLAPRAALERAALRAADAPPDSRRGNRRLHFESVLLELFLSRA